MLKKLPHPSSQRPPKLARMRAAPQASVKAVGKSCNLYYDYIAAVWRIPFDRAQIRHILAVMQRCARLENMEIELRLIDDRAIAALNSEFLCCIGPTNILTFPSDDTMPGSLYLSVDCLHREGLIYGQDVGRHFLRLLAHGFGHLAGLDHGQEMAVLEHRCFNAGIKLLDNGF